MCFFIYMQMLRAFLSLMDDLCVLPHEVTPFCCMKSYRMPHEVVLRVETCRLPCCMIFMSCRTCFIYTSCFYNKCFLFKKKFV